jgi:RNA polymerase sigma-70 factor (ECF subfamily)
LRASHDDYVNEALLDLSQRVRAREGMPDAWYGDGSDVDEAARHYFVKLAMTILRRRVADGFRGTAKRWAERASDDVFERTGAEGPDATRAMLVSRMLRVCVEVLADASEHDRELLMAAVGAISRGGAPVTADEAPLDARDRQRLKRLRDRLAAAVRDRLGEDVSELLREGD